MRTITIADYVPPGVPVVELAEFLDLLGPLAERARWTIGEDMLCTGEMDGDFELMRLGVRHSTIDGRRLRTLALTVEAILEGTLTAHLPGESEPWMTVRFFKNQCVDVSTTDLRALRCLRHRFVDVVTWAF